MRVPKSRKPMKKVRTSCGRRWRRQEGSRCVRRVRRPSAPPRRHRPLGGNSSRADGRRAGAAARGARRLPHDAGGASASASHGHSIVVAAEGGEEWRVSCPSRQIFATPRTGTHLSALRRCALQPWQRRSCARRHIAGARRRDCACARKGGIAAGRRDRPPHCRRAVPPPSGRKAEACPGPHRRPPPPRPPAQDDRCAGAARS